MVKPWILPILIYKMSLAYFTVIEKNIIDKKRAPKGPIKKNKKFGGYKYRITYFAKKKNIFNLS